MRKIEHGFFPARIFVNCASAVGIKRELFYGDEIKKGF